MRCLLKKVFLFWLFCFCVFLVPLHAHYFLTEAELERLEKISEELRASNSQLKTQAASLKATVKTLKEALNEKETLLKNLNDSFALYESEVTSQQERQIEKIDELQRLIEKARKWRRFLYAVIFVLLLGYVFYFGIKFFVKKI